MSPHRTLAASLLLLAAVACGTPALNDDAGTSEDAGTGPEDAGTTTTPPPDAGRPDAGAPDAGQQDAGVTSVDIEDWCASIARARCFQKARCLSLDDAQVPACLARELSVCDQKTYTREVKAGRLQYLPNQAADCVNAYASGSCLERPEACEPVFQGLVAADGGCFLAEECQSGSYCLLYEQKCPFTCYAYKQPGEFCNYWDQQCDPENGACQFADGGYSCRPRKNENAPCMFWSDCRSDLGCINNKCVKQRAGLGEICRETSGYPLCDQELFCRQENITPMGAADAGVCMQRTGLGGVCTGYGTCLAGLRCSSNYATGTCIPLGAVGDKCGNYDDCKSELYCDPPSSRCAVLPADGGNCGSQGSFYRCATGYYCDYNDTTCKALRPGGVPCSYDGVCASNNCEYVQSLDGGSGYRCVESCASRFDGGS